MKMGWQRRREQGQGMTEYIIIVAVVAVLSLAVIMKFGDQIRELFWASGTELSGEDATVTNQMGSESQYVGKSINNL